MRSKQLLLILLISSSVFSYSQMPYNQQENFLKANSVWAFGNKVGIDFNADLPSAINTQMRSWEGCASVADPTTGQLLFYSNGGRCWNRNGEIMLNGDSLLGNSPLGNPNANLNVAFQYSTTQGVCMVPVINEPERYYLFSLRGATSGSPLSSGTLFYSIIDASLDSGLGDIVTGEKNIALNSSSDTLSEAMIAIPGDNCDIWLVLHHYRKNEFIAYHITRDGIDTTPVISTTGYLGAGNAYQVGSLAISPDRQMIAITSAYSDATGLSIGQFDPVTGQISNMIKVDDLNAYGVCFSPDNSKLYCYEHIGETTLIGPVLFQFDVSVLDSSAIANSKVDLYTITFTNLFSDSVAGASLRLYNDTIYISSSSNVSKSISRINQPNLSGLACDLQVAAIPFNSFPNTFSLGNEVVFPLPSDTSHQQVLDTAFCGGTMLTLEGPAGFSGYVWDDGSTDQNREVSQSGIYWVLNVDSCHSRMDTFVVEVYDFIPPVIAVDSFILSTTTSYATYQWLLNGTAISGATQSEYTVLENGDYQVIVSTEDGCMDTSAIYEVTNVTGIDDVSGLGHQITIYPNPATDLVYIQAPVAVDVALCSIEGKLLKYISKASRISLLGIAEGIYLLRIYDREGRLIKTEKIVRSL